MGKIYSNVEKYVFRRVPHWNTLFCANENPAIVAGFY